MCGIVGVVGPVRALPDVEGALERGEGLLVVAVGVETEQQRSALASLGCHDVQGYLLAEPIALEKFHTFLAEQTDKRRAS